MEPLGNPGGFNRSLVRAGTLADPMDRSSRRRASAGALSPGRSRDRSAWCTEARREGDSGLRDGEL